MRSALWGIVVAGSTLAGGLSLGTACGELPPDCVELYTCLGGGGSPGSSSSSSASASSASSSSGTGGGPPATCVPTAGIPGRRHLRYLRLVEQGHRWTELR